MLELAPAVRKIAQRHTERRRVPRIPFKATSVVSEISSSRIVLAQTTELSRFGCFIQTTKPYPQATRVHVKLAEGGATFFASGVVAYATREGMCIVFSMVESKNYQILATLLSRTPRGSGPHSFVATAEVRELGSWNEQVLITRDLSAGGCFIRTPLPLPKGSRIHVRIDYAGAEFTAVGRVTDNVTSEGMGVEFVEVEPKDRIILGKWLAEKSQNADKSVYGDQISSSHPAGWIETEVNTQAE